MLHLHPLIMSTPTKYNKPSKSNPAQSSAPMNIILKKENYYILGFGILLLIIGYLLMSGGEQPANQYNTDEIYSFRRITLAPIVVVIGYIVIAFGVMHRPQKKGDN